MTEPSTGRSAPAGFDPLDRDYVENPYPWLARARADAPVFYMPDHDMWCVTRYREIELALRDTSTYSSRTSSLRPAVPAEVRHKLPNGWPSQMNPTIAMMDPPEHMRIRRLAQKAFSSAAAAAREPTIRALAHQTVDEFVDRGRIDLATAYGQRIPVQVIAPIFGVPREMGPVLHRWALQSTQLSGNMRLSHETLLEFVDGQAAYHRYVSELVEERRANPLDEHDLLTGLILATDDGGESRLTDGEVLSLVLAALTAGSETTATTINHAIHLLLSERTRWEALVDDPAVARNTVEETLRYFSTSRGIYRKTTRDTELAGAAIPEGAVVYLVLASAGRDDEVFADPDSFDLHRDNLREHLGFGLGTHFCLGAALARVEARVALEVLAERIPTLTLAPGQRLRHLESMRVPAVLDGLLVEWG